MAAKKELAELKFTNLLAVRRGAQTSLLPTHTNLRTSANADVYVYLLNSCPAQVPTYSDYPKVPNGTASTPVGFTRSRSATAVQPT